jgi:hypothetical protein
MRGIYCSDADSVVNSMGISSSIQPPSLHALFVMRNLQLIIIYHISHAHNAAGLRIFLLWHVFNAVNAITLFLIHWVLCNPFPHPFLYAGIVWGKVCYHRGCTARIS